MELHLKPDVEAKLSRMAAEQGRSAETLVEEAVERLVDYDEWFLREVETGVERGIDAADHGELIEHSAIRKMIDRRFPG